MLLKHYKNQIAFVIALALFIPCADASIQTPEDIAARIKPLSTICLVGDECAENLDLVVSSSDGPRSGETIFGKHCTACHNLGLLGAPKKGDAAAWAAAEQKAGGFNTLLSHAINGIGNMPAKGTCMDCSDDEISAAIQYMSGLTPSE